MQRWGGHKAALGAMVLATPGGEYDIGTVSQAAECDPKCLLLSVPPDRKMFLCYIQSSVEWDISTPPWWRDVETSFSRCLELSSAFIHSSWVASLLWKRISLSTSVAISSFLLLTWKNRSGCFSARTKKKWIQCFLRAAVKKFQPSKVPSGHETTEVFLCPVLLPFCSVVLVIIHEFQTEVAPQA